MSIVLPHCAILLPNGVESCFRCKVKKYQIIKTTFFQIALVLPGGMEAVGDGGATDGVPAPSPLPALPFRHEHILNHVTTSENLLRIGISLFCQILNVRIRTKCF